MQWSDNTKITAKLLALAAGMLGFAIFVMPPLYDAFCEITGLNGKTGGRYQAVPAAVDKDRLVTVQFVASNNENMPWRFRPSVVSLKVHPGEAVETVFLAENPTGRDMIGQAIPSLVPFKAAEYFHKTECFCFNQQTLAAGEAAELSLRFIVDPELPPSVNTITLSYTLFDVTEGYSSNFNNNKMDISKNRSERVSGGGRRSGGSGAYTQYASIPTELAHQHRRPPPGARAVDF